MLYLVDPKNKPTCESRCRPFCHIKPCYGVPTCRQILL